MLTLALTRPQLRWIERLTEDSPRKRLWAERALTLFGFAMGGYAWAALFIVLHKQLGEEVSAMLKGAGFFLIPVALLVHFEPFLTASRLNGWLAALILYIGVVVFGASLGVAMADFMLTSSLDVHLLVITGILALGTWAIYKLMPRLEALAERL